MQASSSTDKIKSLPRSNTALARFFQSEAAIARLSMVSADSEFPKTRLVRKDGHYNVQGSRVGNPNKVYIRDVYTTLVEANWMWTILFVGCTFVFSWTLFSGIYYVIAWAHGDLSPELIEDPNSVAAERPTCIQHATSFVEMLLFSLETQHTIGYGYRYITEKCPAAVIATFAQAVSGTLIEAFLVAVTIGTLVRPKKRAETLLFSQNAIIAMRNNKLCLMFRVGDMRKSHFIDPKIRLLLIKRLRTIEGEVIPFYQMDMTATIDKCPDSYIFFQWPVIVTHVINAHSPLYDLSKQSLANAEFEIVVILEGGTESTGARMQARTSYVPKEIIWGHRFEPLFSFMSTGGAYRIDYDSFNNSYEVPTTPTCSAKALNSRTCENHTDGQLNSPQSEDRSVARQLLLSSTSSGSVRSSGGTTRTSIISRDLFI